MEKAAGDVHSHEVEDFGAATGLTEDRDISRIATECGDVVAYPAQRQHQVEQPDVADRVPVVEGAQIEKSERGESVVDGDQNDVLSGHESIRQRGNCAAHSVE